MNPRLPTARELALAALCDRAGNVTARLNRLLAEQPLPEPEAALARELALGVVRRRGTLDAVVAVFRQPGGRLPPRRIREILRLGIYQLLFLDRVPAFAAVNEAVGQVGPGRSMRGFVNALLREVVRSVSPPAQGEPPAARDTLALGGGSFRRFNRPVFPHPQADAAGYLAAAFSLPRELAEKWLADVGSLEAVVPLALHANARPPLIVRVNPLRASVADVLEGLRGEGARALAHANGLSVAVTGGASLSRLSVFAAGKVQPQDPGATAVVAAADLRPGMRVLDLCAAPGTKTTHLAERMQDRGEIVAVDVSRQKLARIEENCRRMGFSIVRTMLASDLATLEPESFHLVLADVPCSNTGVLARRPEARWRFSRRQLGRLARDQRSLLLLGAQYARRGAQCVYSTCSLEKEENEAVVRHAVSRLGDLHLRRERRIAPAGADDPARWSDGVYFAVLSR